jgi:hypothetical protein
VSCETVTKPIFNLVRVCTRPVRQSIFDFARCTLVAGALCATSPVFAGSSDADLSNDSGDDPTHPLGKIELLDRFTTAPGPGAAEGTTKRVDTNTPFARIETPFRIAPQWELAFRVEIPVVWTNPVTPQNPSGQVITGFGNVLTQTWLIYEINPRWAVAAGAQVIAPTATNGVASDAWEEVTGAVVRVMLPELSEGSYFAPQVRYGVDFGGNDEGPLLRQLRHADPQHQFPSRSVFDLLSESGYSLELRNPGTWPDRPVLLASQLHDRLEAH